MVSHVDRCHNSVYVGGCKISSQASSLGGKFSSTATLPLHIAAEEAWMSIKALQPTVMDKAPRHQRQRAAAEPERYTPVREAKHRLRSDVEIVCVVMEKRTRV